MHPLLADIYNFLFPRRCVMCGSRLAVGEKSICASCVMHLPRTATQLGKEQSALEKRFWAQFPIERAASFFYYSGDDNRHLLHSLKYYEHPQVGYDLARICAEEMEGSGFFDGVDVIVPLPIHWRRLLHRHYNQSEYIAKGLSAATGIPVCANAVRRIVNNPSQTAFSPKERRENVKGIFRLVRPSLVEGKHVLLVDDVITTGATIASCAAELSSVQGVRISIFSLALAKSTNIPTTDTHDVDILTVGLPLLD